MVPQRFALAAQADGWYVRQEIIWAKGVSFLPDYAGSCMPESVQDRPVRGHEQVWMLTKRPKYFWDQEAVKEGLRYPDAADGSRTFGGTNKHGANIQHGDRTTGGAYDNTPTGRSLRSVWVINPGSFPGAHFATFPEKLVEPMVKAATSAHGVCPNCQAPWIRVIEKGGGNWEERKASGAPMRYGMNNNKGQAITNYGKSQSTTTGWQPSCTCNVGDPVPATILDPFVGSGTTLRVALRLGRHAIGVDISEVYLAEHIEQRVSNLQFELAI
jgi:DNA modification methylase